jgi:antitoxin ParD1/3/4
MSGNTSITLDEHFDKFAVEKIKEGRFQSVSEVVCAGLRKLEEDEAKLQAGEDGPVVQDLMGIFLLRQCMKNTSNDAKLPHQAAG